MKGPILAADLAGMLVFGGFIPAEAQDDPEGHDNCRTMEKVGYLADLLNATVNLSIASTAVGGAFPAHASQSMIDAGEAVASGRMTEIWEAMRGAALAELGGGKTGWPPGLLQDDHKGLSKWLASRPDARRRVREALADQGGK